MREGITTYISHEDVVDSDLSKILACKSSPHAKSATLLFFFQCKKKIIKSNVFWRSQRLNYSEELKQTLEGLVQAGNLTDAQSAELM